MGMGMVLVGAVATIGAGIAAWLRVGTTLRSAMGWFILCLTTPLVFIAFGELRGIGFELARWEGGNYLLPAMYSSLVYVFFLAGPAR